MKNYLFLFLIASMAVACKSDADDAPLVTEVVLSPASGVVVPGDEVTFTAQGLEVDDQIMLRVSWPLEGEVIPEGYADGLRAVVTARTATGMTFLAPGGWPAGRLDVKLFRGSKIMLLGSLSIADGQPPKEFLLYSLTHSAAETIIRRIDRTSGQQTDIRTLGGADRIRCAVNSPGSNIIQGLASDGGVGFYDLTMRYNSVIPARKTAAAGSFYNVGVVFLRYAGGLVYPDVSSVTRMNSPSSTKPWSLPEWVLPEMLSYYPFVSVYESYLLLSVRRAAGTYVPMALDLTSTRVMEGADVPADAMIPIRILEPKENGAPSFSASFAVASGGKTSLRPLPLQSTTLGDPEILPEIPGTVRSVASCQSGAATQDIYLLCDVGAKRQIHVLSLPAKTLRTIPGEFSCDEIVLVR